MSFFVLVKSYCKKNKKFKTDLITSFVLLLATLLTKAPTQALCRELCEILKNTFFAKTSANGFFVFSSRSVPIPKIITNRCGMEYLNVKGVHRKCY